MDAKYYKERGNTWFDKGDYDRAIADYNKAIELDPEYAEAYNGRGDAWLSKGDLDQAIADFTKALEMNPHYAGAPVDILRFKMLSFDLAMKAE